jgi:hypothetical protein
MKAKAKKRKRRVVRVPDLKRLSPNHVLSIPEHCALLGIAVWTERRARLAGKGARVVHLSERRLGVRVQDHLAFIESRVEQ